MVKGRPTLDTIALAAGVSRMTVSNAYNRPDQLSQRTRERVLRIAADLGYPGPDPAGRSLRRRRTGTIGVLLTERLPYAFADPGTVAFLHGVATELAEAGQALLLLPVESNTDHSLIRSALVDGFLLVSLARDDPAVADVVSRRLPTVSSGHPRIPGVPRLGIDNARASSTVARHLLDLGHASYGVVTFGGRPAIAQQDEPAGGADDGTEAGAVVPGVHQAMRQRVTGFVRALREAGVQAADVEVVEAARNSRAAGARAAATLLEHRPGGRPTAIFGVTDVLALGVLDAAADVGLAVPGQLSVAGFDDIADAARSVPPLTTMSQALFDQGRLAARMVLDLVAGRTVRAPKIGTELVVRSSTAPPGS